MREEAMEPAYRAPGGSAPDVLNVELRLRWDSRVPSHAIVEALDAFLARCALASPAEALTTESEMRGWRDDPVLAGAVELISVGECSNGLSAVLPGRAHVRAHLYKLVPDAVEEFTVGGDDEGEEEPVTAASIAVLPRREFDGLWRTLIYNDDVKLRLLQYIYSTIELSECGIDGDIIAWNRLVLLHGPPGTGKTSLCKALAQKLAIRLGTRYASTQLVEINSHSLFSKWFSESGKLVQRLFSMILELVEQRDTFVVILIDEVESLATARSASLGGLEPSDAVRVVNAVLTQLDKLKHHKNVLVMTTSNISEAMDSAFMDRADIKQYIGPPSPEAIYWILRSCLHELMAKGLATPIMLNQWSTASMLTVPPTSPAASDTAEATEASEARRASFLLAQLARQTNGLSGRLLRRLPVLALARHIASPARPVPTATWIEAMTSAARDARTEARQVQAGSSAPLSP